MDEKNLIKKLRSKKTKKLKETKVKMESLGTYLKEFDDVIERYAWMSVQYEKMYDEWCMSGCIVADEFTNKNGEPYEKKTVLYSSLENLRKELVAMENILGLTPKGIKAIKTKGIESSQKKSFFDSIKDFE